MKNVQELEAWFSSPEFLEQHAKRQRTVELRKILTAFSEDFAQAAAGLHIADLEERKEKFRQAHAELRQLEGKEPRLLA